MRQRGRFNFSYPSHAAIRAAVFRRDAFACKRCPAMAVDVPAGYNGRFTLWTDTRTGAGTRDMLIVDHVVTLAAGGSRTIDNLQTLCETCNKRKIREDVAAAASFRSCA